MEKTSVKTLLKEAVANLIGRGTERYVSEKEIVRKARLLGYTASQASVSRAAGGEHSIGIDIVEGIAAAFKLSAWQILVPGFRLEAPPALLNSDDPLKLELLRLYERLDEDERLALVLKARRFAAANDLPDSPPTTPQPATPARASVRTLEPDRKKGRPPECTENTGRLSAVIIRLSQRIARRID